MNSSLDDIKFLVGSSNRITVLEAIRDSPRTPHELREVTGASRMTVNRILDSFEDRGWIVHENGQCESTTRGAIIAHEFTQLLGPAGGNAEAGRRSLINLDVISPS